MNYQEECLKFRLPTYTPEATVLGFLSESGEVAAVFQKLIRGDYPPDVAATKLHAEIGDVLFHIYLIAYDNGWDVEDIKKANIEKLESRKIRNVIVGSGDNR